MFRWVICHFRRGNVRCRQLSYTLLQPRYRRRTDTLLNVCRLPGNICSTFVLLTSYLCLICITLLTIVFFPDLLSVVHFQCWLSFWYRQSLFQYNVSLRHRWPWPILVILFSPFGFIAPINLSYWLSNLSILSVPDEGYSRNASCSLNLISTFSLLHLPI